MASKNQDSVAIGNQAYPKGAILSAEQGLLRKGEFLKHCF